MSDTAAPLSLEQKLDGGCRPQTEVPLCLNGRLRNAYEKLERRIVARLAAAEQEYNEAADAEVDDVRLSTPTRPPFVPTRDEEQDELDEIEAEMRRYVEVFVVQAMDPDDYDTLIEQFPPRLLEDGTRDPRDWRGANAEKFNPALLRASIVPELTEPMFKKVMRGLSAAQKERLLTEAVAVNRKDDDVPFLQSGSGRTPTSGAA